MKFLTQLKEEKHPLIVGGDARADSPGHTAKFGSYSLIEFTHNKILDFKLVRVSKHYFLIIYHTY